MDKGFILYEIFDTVIKDNYLVFFNDHSWKILFGLLNSILVPFVWTLTKIDSKDFDLLIWVFYGTLFRDLDDKFSFIRWNIAARIAIFENIPQIMLVLIEAFGLKKTMSFYQVVFPILSTIAAVYHLALVTGEAFCAP